MNQSTEEMFSHVTRKGKHQMNSEQCSENLIGVAGYPEKNKHGIVYVQCCAALSSSVLFGSIPADLQCLNPQEADLYSNVGSQLGGS